MSAAARAEIAVHGIHFSPNGKEPKMFTPASHRGLVHGIDADFKLPFVMAKPSWMNEHIETMRNKFDIYTQPASERDFREAMRAVTIRKDGKVAFRNPSLPYPKPTRPHAKLNRHRHPSPAPEDERRDDEPRWERLPDHVDEANRADLFDPTLDRFHRKNSIRIQNPAYLLHMPSRPAVEPRGNGRDMPDSLIQRLSSAISAVDRAASNGNTLIERQRATIDYFMRNGAIKAEFTSRARAPNKIHTILKISVRSYKDKGQFIGLGGSIARQIRRIVGVNSVMVSVD